ncbi:unnamed protein product [Rotaria sordida]|uniref:BHLH domain-containing protein n=1 Tax=Rotaria sordida TaxID=392033 RepID=A0A813TVB6_9BILA|nr:unnamed protein product [Rotaria sordida]CAF0814840.1 unnamed protein product [Rotaria sordida]CAF0855041.1 unnamed protein product [Rotaria sordida]CAF0897773.1 unnamed protein product [Rotaria sordida]CAF0902791.1 unnamed protein product [Rotaria sordida]
MITITNLDDNYYELGQEFQKLALLVPTIPKDRCISELEFIEFVIAYIRELQQLLSYNQWNEHMNKLTSSMKNSIVLSSSSLQLYKQIMFQSSRIQTNESSSTIHRSPLASINLNNTQLS